MTDRLTTALRGLADGVPAAAVPEDLFDAARRRHRGRRAAAAGALAVLVLVLSVGYALRPVALPAPSASRVDAPGLPSRLVAPRLLTASVDGSPPGPAAALFGGPAVRSDWHEDRMAVVAAGADRYRRLDAGPASPGFDALLSPDGRHVWAGGRLFDLTTGEHTGAGVHGHPLAFAPDGRRLAYAAEDTFTAPNTYATPYVGLYDRERRADVLRVPVGTAWVPPGRAAVTPDGGTLAIQVRNEVWLTRVADAGADGTATPYLKLPGRLAGPGAWLPDGQSVAVVSRKTCGRCPGPVPTYRRSWQLVVPTRLTAASFPAVNSATFVQVLGWRSADEAVALVGVPGPDAVNRPDEHDIASSPYHEPGTAAVQVVLLRRGAAAPEVLWRTPDGVTELSVAADLAVDGAVRKAGEPDFGPPPSWLVALGLAGVTLLVGAGIGLVRSRRRRRRARPAGEVASAPGG
ncbi:WD40 repeat domain-containing protein [Micromonospora sp. URMC 106]|uniref:WD40 repeat domain-containing protein n=1 Tax=Micromonospora sp. URMC 106 TaxID=3423408 RepID=UPI003F1BC9B7